MIKWLINLAMAITSFVYGYFVGCTSLSILPQLLLLVSGALLLAIFWANLELYLLDINDK